MRNMQYLLEVFILMLLVLVEIGKGITLIYEEKPAILKHASLL